MGKIKSAWEIALEKTEGITIDKDKFRHGEDVAKARRIAGSYLTGDETDAEKLKKELEAVEPSARKEALTASILSSLSLPQDEVVEYTLQSGDPSIYFFDDIQKITCSGDTIVIGDVSCEIVDGEIFYMQSISVLVSRSCITFSIPNAPMLVYVS